MKANSARNRALRRAWKILYWVLLTLILLGTLLFSTLGRLTIASPSVLKSAGVLVADLLDVIILTAGLLAVLPRWWKLVALSVLVVGLMGNFAGWASEGGFASMARNNRMSMSFADVAGDILLLPIPFALAYFARRIGYPKEAPESAPPNQAPSP